MGYLLPGINTIGHSFQNDEGLQIRHADHSTDPLNDRWPAEVLRWCRRGVFLFFFIIVINSIISIVLIVVLFRVLEGNPFQKRPGGVSGLFNLNTSGILTK